MPTDVEVEREENKKGALIAGVSETRRNNLGSKIHETNHPEASICRRSSVSRLEEEDEDNTDGHSNSNLNSPPAQMQSGALDLEQVPVRRTSLGVCEPTYHMGPEPDQGPRNWNPAQYFS